MQDHLNTFAEAELHDVSIYKPVPYSMVGKTETSSKYSITGKEIITYYERYVLLSYKRNLQVYSLQ
jgi:hypothetical protein